MSVHNPVEQDRRSGIPGTKGIPGLGNGNNGHVTGTNGSLGWYNKRNTIDENKESETDIDNQKKSPNKSLVNPTSKTGNTKSSNTKTKASSSINQPQSDQPQSTDSTRTSTTPPKSTPTPEPTNPRPIKSPLNQLERQISIARSKSLSNSTKKTSLDPRVRSKTVNSIPRLLLDDIQLQRSQTVGQLHRSHTVAGKVQNNQIAERVLRKEDDTHSSDPISFNQLQSALVEREKTSNVSKPTVFSRRTDQTSETASDVSEPTSTDSGTSSRNSGANSVGPPNTPASFAVVDKFSFDRTAYTVSDPQPLLERAVLVTRSTLKPKFVRSNTVRGRSVHSSPRSDTTSVSPRSLTRSLLTNSLPQSLVERKKCLQEKELPQLPVDVKDLQKQIAEEFGLGRTREGTILNDRSDEYSDNSFAESITDNPDLFKSNSSGKVKRNPSEKVKKNPSDQVNNISDDRAKVAHRPPPQVTKKALKPLEKPEETVDPKPIQRSLSVGKRLLGRTLSFKNKPPQPKRSISAPIKMHSPTKQSRFGDDDDDDTASIYSFDSVSTNGRLLDRLDLDDFDSYNNQRYSMLLMKNDDLYAQEPSYPSMELNVPPAKQYSAEAVYAMSTRPNLTNILPKRTPDSNEAILRQVQRNIVLTQSPGQPQNIPNQGPTQVSQSLLQMQIQRGPPSQRQGFDSAPQSQPSQLNQNKTTFLGRSNNTPPFTRTSSAPGIQRMPSAPVRLNTYVDGRRTVSDSPLGNHSESALPSLLKSKLQNTPQGYTDQQMESGIATAQQLRAAGKHRELSYQLQLLANVPNNYPRAMYLYAMSLRSGLGVKQNDVQAVKWLCKCILINVNLAQTGALPNNANTTSLIEKLNELLLDSLLKLILKQLTHTIDQDPLKQGSEPQLCYTYFQSLPKAKISRLIQICKYKLDVVAQSYLELGNMVFSGSGFTTKDETNGIKLLLMAASSGNTDAMVQLGEIWSTRLKSHKKDLFKASAWLRLSELLGVKSIGNSWIYKEKYMKGK